MPPTNVPPNDEPPNEPTTFESINDPDKVEYLETSGEALALASLWEGDEINISGGLERELPTITHTTWPPGKPPPQPCSHQLQVGAYTCALFEE